jgi:hypothetical protein
VRAILPLINPLSIVIYDGLEITSHGEFAVIHGSTAFCCVSTIVGAMSSDCRDIGTEVEIFVGIIISEGLISISPIQAGILQW